MTKHPTFFMRLVSPVYQGAWRLARPFLGKHRRLTEGWGERLVPEDWASGFDGKTVWIQAASGGEAYLLVNIAKELQAYWQNAGKGDLRILATTCTRQGMDVLEKGLSSLPSVAGVEFVLRYFPLDEPRLMRRAVQQAGPALIVLLETELWPGLLMAAWENNVPVQLLNGRITPKSMRGYEMLPAPFWKKLAPAKILAVSDADAERYAKLFGAEAVGLMPNIKFDLLASQQNEKPVKTANNDKIALFASVRRQEAAQVAKAVQILKKNVPECQVLLVPRHLHHVSLWQQQISLMGLKSALRSKIAGEQASPEEALASIGHNIKNSVVIWDRFGELNKLYSLASAAYVGGSLVPLGGQNFLEALAAGIEPCIGLHYSNFAWAGEEILDMTRQVSDPFELAVTLGLQLENSAPKTEVQVRFEKSVARKQGGTRAAVNTIFELLDARFIELKNT